MGNFRDHPDDWVKENCFQPDIGSYSARPPADFDLHTPERYPVEEGSVLLALVVCCVPAFLMGVGVGWWLL